jgi:stage II sporulation protein D
VATLAFCASLALVRALPWTAQNTEKPVETFAEENANLQRLAESALGKDDGAVVVIDPQTGRVLAIANPTLACKNAFPPGSTLKPFTTLAALRAGVIGPDTRMRCRGKYKRADVVDACSHPPNLAPFNPAEALAHSCNYYFATVGERLKEENFADLLAGFGFGQPTGIDVDESTGVLARGRWQPESAVGEGEFLQVTPIQLATAYAALFNGGWLFKPTVAPAAYFMPGVRRKLEIDDRERATLLAGMRGAVEFGTAEEAEIDSVPAYVIGKTGTSTPLRGFRPHGWFVSIAFAPNIKTGQAEPQLLVVVYLKNAHGAQAAGIARTIFKSFTGVPALKDASTYVTVNQVSENVTRKMPLEDYILQVVSSEASVEDEPEALKALAVAARTYALKNTGRHQEQGYDFCSTTHCQRFESTGARRNVAAVVKETTGLVLTDDHDKMADSYYSASCGGMTANLKTLWGADAPGHLRGVRDDFCNSGSHYRWTDVITAPQLARALRSDPRTDVGETIREVSVSKYDETGRAELLSITGDRRRSITGWEFKLIVGRALGWNLVKSSRFSVSRSGSGFVFRGGGFGHGLGLCQEGSHAMAQRGHSFQQILAHYFPRTSVTKHHVEPRISLRSSHFRLHHSKLVQTREAEQMLSLLEKNRTELLRRVAAAGISVNFPNLEVFINETTGDFVGRTGLPPWAAAATKNNRIELQPLALLKQRGILETTLRHELVHVLIDAIGSGVTPRWLTEGMAIYVAGEGRLIERGRQQKPVSSEIIEQALASAKSAADMQSAYAGAYHLVKEMIQVEGESKVWKRVATRRYYDPVSL